MLFSSLLLFLLLCFFLSFHFSCFFLDRVLLLLLFSRHSLINDSIIFIFNFITAGCINLMSSFDFRSYTIKMGLKTINDDNDDEDGDDDDHWFWP